MVSLGIIAGGILLLCFLPAPKIQTRLKQPMPPRVPLFLAGPTAAGKSAVAVCLAEKLGGEIISVDSMQVFVV